MSFEVIYQHSGIDGKTTISVAEPDEPGVLSGFIGTEKYSLLIEPLPNDGGLTVRLAYGHDIIEADDWETADAIRQRLLQGLPVIVTIPAGYSYKGPENFWADPEVPGRILVRHIIDTPGVLPDRIN